MASAAAPAVLITRSEPGASATARRLEEAGFTPILTPMLHIAPRPPPKSLKGVQALLVTSVNGALRLVEAPQPLPRILAVGGATADAARAAGAAEVLSAEGDVAALIALARRVLDPAAGPVAHWRGGDVAGDVAGALRAAGFTAREHVVYAAVAHRAVSPAARLALEQGEAAAVTFHSARGARAFLAAVAEARLSGALSGLVAASLSPQAGAPAAAAGFAALVSAAQPNEPSLIRALAQALSHEQ